MALQLVRTQPFQTRRRRQLHGLGALQVVRTQPFRRRRALHGFGDATPAIVAPSPSVGYADPGAAETADRLWPFLDTAARTQITESLTSYIQPPTETDVIKEMGPYVPFFLRAYFALPRFLRTANEFPFETVMARKIPIAAHAAHFVMRVAGTATAAIHGRRRNRGDTTAAILWGGAGFFAPIVTNGVAVLQARR
jgi:hypothetical protein